MISVLLGAGYATRMYPLTENFPKPLLPVGGQSILERLMLDIDRIPEVSRHVVISNHKFIEHFGQWKHESGVTKPLEIIDDGTTSNDNRLGAVRDVLLAIESLRLDDDLLVVAGDNLLTFSLSTFVDSFEAHHSSMIMCYHEPERNVLQRCGVLELGEDMRVLSMEEKPREPKSHWAVPPFYVYARQDLPLVRRGVEAGIPVDAPGSFIAWLCKQTPVHALVMPGQRIDVGDLESYRRIQEQFS